MNRRISPNCHLTVTADNPLCGAHVLKCPSGVKESGGFKILLAAYLTSLKNGIINIKLFETWNLSDPSC